MAKHSTHSLSFVECVVASNKVASARKAHVEMPKVERFRMREGRKGEHPEAKRPPNMPPGECMFWFIFKYIKHVPELPPIFPKLALVGPVPSLVFLIPRQITLFGEWA